MDFRRLVFLISDEINAVSVVPGASVVTTTPLPSNSAVRVSEKAKIKDLVAEYTE